MTMIGERIGAIQKANQTAVWFFGYGVYAGDEVPPSGFLHDLDRPNPKLQLDNGDVVWGYESWWGPEDQIKDVIGDRQVIIVEPER